ncbi:endonuclease/exonuclease/phosphatase family protein [Gottschalkia purinilytica]|uniref:endonuclease/exonuclease/phosphatase family protein n=1 Tax=Gottschalkia purinilytica TaxID=1503 RepID=UPI001F167893|nr:endonuclease/exonuclease/phosphatase family protein [Gottschalkia purinilytica]
MIGLIVYTIIKDYRPDKEVSLDIENNQSKILKREDVISGITFNIGYGGLDEGRDFFMDGGKMSRSESKEKTQYNLEKMIETLSDKKVDFIFLQEIDIDSSRSFHINQVDYYRNEMKGYGSTFGKNYDVPWVPVPFTRPMGKALSGIMTFSKYKIDKAIRYSLPGEYNFLVQLFQLDRCIVENRILVEDGKELVLINVHLSAYDKEGVIREEQSMFLKSFVEKEYEKGNYVVVGGDWNQLMPNVDNNKLNPKRLNYMPDWLVPLSQNFNPKGFKWAVDIQTPTVRSIDKPYKKGENFVTVIDGFLVSNNLEILETKGIDLDFKYSDHNPVYVKLKLK